MNAEVPLTEIGLAAFAALAITGAGHDVKEAVSQFVENPDLNTASHVIYPSSMNIRKFVT